MLYTALVESFTEILVPYRPLFLTAHILFMAIGLGGATVSDILFFRFLKDFRISKKEEEVLHVLKNVILSAIFVITITGIALYIPAAERLNSSSLFLVKATVTIILIVNGIALHAFVAPHLLHLNLREHDKMGRGWHKLAFLLGGISFCSWYSAFFIAMLKDALPFGYMHGVLVYLGFLGTAMVASQVLEHFLSSKAQK